MFRSGHFKAKPEVYDGNNSPPQVDDTFHKIGGLGHGCYINQAVDLSHNLNVQRIAAIAQPENDQLPYIGSAVFALYI